MDVTIGSIQRIFNNLLSILNLTFDGFTIGSITPAPGTFTTLNATTSNLGTISSGTIAGGAVIDTGTAYCATATSYVSTATLQALPGFTVALAAGGTYQVNGQVPVTTANNAAGVQLALNASNGLTLTTATVVGTVYNGVTIATAPVTVHAVATDMVSFANTATLITLNGTIVVNAAGTLGLSSAQHTSSASTSTIGAGGYLQVTRIS